MRLNLPGSDELDRATAEAFADPRPGDVFEEFASVWVSVTARDGDRVTWRHSWGGGREDHDTTVAEFGAFWAYRSIPGYSVKLHRRGGS